MAKNLPARERPARRTHGKYAQHGKSAFTYSIGAPSKALLSELHAARVAAFGTGYKDEQRDYEAISAARRGGAG